MATLRMTRGVLCDAAGCPLGARAYRACRTLEALFLRRREVKACWLPNGVSR